MLHPSIDYRSRGDLIKMAQQFILCLETATGLHRIPRDPKDNERTESPQ